MRVGFLSKTGISPQGRSVGTWVPRDFGSFPGGKAVRLFRPLLLAAFAGAVAMQSAETRAADLSPPPVMLGAPASANTNFFQILYNSYAEEWNKLPPSDPNAPPTRRSEAEIAPAPQTAPPYPYADWPFGGSEVIGGSTPNAVDSPLMKALIGGTPVGKPLEDAHIQIYGWVNVGGNVSTAKTGYNGNAPVGYAFTPDIVQLDQAVVYIERIPDEVQKQHWDWGFRLSPIYGENYRYTTGLGFDSNQLVIHNHYTGFDMPMAYGELYIPNVAEGMNIRVGRYISLPDIEAQLAPNNYMYTHSLTYTFDGFTNTGIVASVKLNKNWMVQAGLSAGTETFPWNATHINLPNGYSGPRDPGTQPTGSVCVQYQTDTNYDNVYVCANGINNGLWGYNNLQWYGGTYYHKFNEQFNVSFEGYYEYERGVPSKLNGPGYQGTAFQFDTNAPLLAACGNNQTSCTANEYGLLAYWNYRLGTFDNISLRTEFYNDMKGQRTGFATRYVDVGLGWQHWFGPQVEVRPEVTYYRSLDTAAFDNGTASHLVFVGGDVIWHF
jgi:hypothetical protein